MIVAGGLRILEDTRHVGQVAANLSLADAIGGFAETSGAVRVRHATARNTSDASGYLACDESVGAIDIVGGVTAFLLCSAIPQYPGNA